MLAHDDHFLFANVFLYSDGTSGIEFDGKIRWQTISSKLLGGTRLGS